MRERVFWKGFLHGFKEFSQTLALVINTFLLAIVYLVGVGLTALCAKMVHKHFLERKVNRKQPSYWSDLLIKTKVYKEYGRQF